MLRFCAEMSSGCWTGLDWTGKGEGGLWLIGSDTLPPAIGWFESFNGHAG